MIKKTKPRFRLRKFLFKISSATLCSLHLLALLLLCRFDLRSRPGCCLELGVGTDSIGPIQTLPQEIVFPAEVRMERFGLSLNNIEQCGPTLSNKHSNQKSEHQTRNLFPDGQSPVTHPLCQVATKRKTWPKSRPWSGFLGGFLVTKKHGTP